MTVALQARPKKKPAKPKQSWRDRLAALGRQRVERQHERSDEYMTVSRSLHDGKDVDDTEAARILDQFGESNDDLARDVETYGHRVKWRAEIDKIPGYKKRLAEVEQELGELQQQEGTFLAEMKHRVTPQVNERSTLIARQSGRPALRTKLIATAWKDMRAEATQTAERMKACGAACARKREYLHELETGLKPPSKQAGRGSTAARLRRKDRRETTVCGDHPPRENDRPAKAGTCGLGA